MEITLEHRVKSPPVECCIVPESIPILSFGNFQSATVATLGLNPSRVEFLDRSGRLLVGAHARFETLASLRVDTLAEASSEITTRVLNSCESYFRKNPYSLWFNPLDEIIGGLGASYYKGSACHLDLAQWATDPTWGKLTPQIRDRLVADGLPFLRWQLS
jgi:hypothetical protein